MFNIVPGIQSFWLKSGRQFLTILWISNNIWLLFDKITNYVLNYLNSINEE